MRAIVVAGAFTLIAGWWTASARPGTPPQAPLSGLPPVDYSLGPDSQPQAGVPKGTVTQHRLAPGKFFPGTPHDYQIYVPAQHDPARPIAWMIFLDGNGYAGDNVRVPVVLDKLLARRELPPMMAIFLSPGVMPALSDQAQNRYERIFEYKPEFTATPVTSIAFGGPDRAWLYVTQGGKISRRETRRTGVVAWELVKPPQPGL